MAPQGKFAWFRSDLNQAMCMGVNGGLKVGAEVSLTWYHEGDHQLWYEDLAYNVLRIKGGETEHLVLEERSDSSLIINHFDPNNENQKWIVERNRICRKQDPSRVVTVPDFNLPLPIGMRVSDYETLPKQMWQDVHLEADFFTISSTKTAGVLTIAGQDNPVGATIIVADAASGNDISKEWYLDKCGVIRARSNGYTIAASGSENKAVSLADNPVGVYDASWVTEKAGDSYTIINRHTKLCLAVGAENDTPVKIETYSGSSNAHTWEFNPVN